MNSISYTPFVTFEPLPKKQKLFTESFNGTLIAKEEIDSALFAKIETIKRALISDADCGKKHENNVRMQRLISGLGMSGFEVPSLCGISTTSVRSFLQRHNLDIIEEWKKSDLGGIQKKIAAAFDIASINDENFSQLAGAAFIKWLEQAQNHYLMVRSTGAEDSHKTANAGGNKSCSYVSPTRQTFCQAAKEVVCSYFDKHSLNNLIKAGVNPFAQDPILAVTAQILIGESGDQIPTSLVLFTSIDEEFRLMRISATYGHGEGVVRSSGVATDTVLLLESLTHPDHLYVLYDNADKPVRLAPVEGSLQLVPNPEHLRKEPVLNSEQLARLFAWGVVAERFFGDKATDMELVIKGNTIYPVQARPVIRPQMVPTYFKGLDGSLRGEVLVPGRASVVEISDPEEICFTATLEEADRQAYQNHKAVIVTTPEPAMSHPVVNFTGLGVPCLLFSEEAKKLIQQCSEERPLLLCVQEGTLTLWDRSKGDPQILPGYTTHPAKIAISLPIYARTWGEKGEIPGEVKELYRRLRSSETHEVALAALAKLREHPFAEIHNLTHQNETSRALELLNQKVEIAFQETEAVLKRSFTRLPFLFHVKVLGTLLFSSKISLHPYIADAKELIQYQEKFAQPVRFAEIYLAGNAAFEPSSRRAWRVFLERLELNATSYQVKRLHSIIRTLESTGMLSTWFAFFFDGKLESVLKTFTPFDEQKLKSRHTLQIKALMAGASPLTSLIILNTLQQIVDEQDGAIKRMKASAEWTREEKVPLFAKMLRPYFELLQQFVRDLNPDIPMNEYDNLPKYMATLHGIFAELEKKLETKQLEPSRTFSVAAAAMGSCAVFYRHHPATLEDFFTLVHQNLLVILSHCKAKYLSDALIQRSALPQNFLKALTIVKWARLGVEISEREIRVLFNIPLGLHSAQMALKYAKNGGMSVQGYLLGEDGCGRWKATAFVADILNEMGLLPLNAPIQISYLEVKFDWKAPDEAALMVIVQEFKHFCSQSYSRVDFASLLKRHKFDKKRLIEATLKRMSYELDDSVWEPAPVKKLLREMFKAPLFAEDAGKAMTSFIEKAIVDNDKIRCVNALSLIGHIVSFEAQDWIQTPLVALCDYLIVNKSSKQMTKALEHLEKLILRKYGIPTLSEKILSWAKKYVYEKDHEFLAYSIDLLILQLKTGTSITQEVINLLDGLAEKAFDNDFKTQFFDLLQALMAQKHRVKPEIEDKLISLIKEMIDDENADFQYLLSGSPKLDLLSVAIKGLERSHFLKLLDSPTVDLAEVIAEECGSFDLFDYLVGQNQSLAKASDAAGKGIVDASKDVRERALQLFKKLFEKGQGFDLAIWQADIGARSPEAGINQSAVNLLLELIKYGKGFEESLAAAPILAPTLANKLLTQVMKAQDHRKLGKTTIAILKSTAAESVRLNALSSLFENGKVVNADLFAAAKQAVDDPSATIRTVALNCFVKLTNDSFGKYRVISAAAAKHVEDPNYNLRRKVVTLFRALFKKGHGRTEATAKANKALRNPNNAIRKTAQQLLYDGVRK